MKPLLHFLRTTFIGGLLFLVPLIALVVVVGKALVLAHKLVDPLAAHIPVESVFGLRTPALLGIAVVVLFCFLAGVIARASFAKKLVRGLEATVLSKVPGYAMLKSVSESTLGVEQQGTLPVVLVRFDDGWQIGLLVERIENGLSAVFVPGSPDTQSGSVYFLTADRVQAADIPLAATLKCLKSFGVGSHALLRGFAAGPAAEMQSVINAQRPDFRHQE